ncbi:MAG TPA: hypothetical protein VK828_00135 [Terriglobales bacterium]|jgi:hypothetical protein|nr:hypothetical protein [Terriglobales bacterium]
MNNFLSCNRKMICLLLLALVGQAGAQVLGGDELKKLAPSAFFFAGQSAAVQLRNTVGLKNSDGKIVMAGLVDTSGYSTAVAEKYQGFLITETKLGFDGASLEPGEYGFGFKDGKFTVMNVAATNLLSVASQKDDQLKRPIPLKLEKDGAAYRLYAGRTYVVLKAD